MTIKRYLENNIDDNQEIPTLWAEFTSANYRYQFDIAFKGDDLSTYLVEVVSGKADKLGDFEDEDAVNVMVYYYTVETIIHPVDAAKEIISEFLAVSGRKPNKRVEVFWG